VEAVVVEQDSLEDVAEMVAMDLLLYSHGKI
jgi:hypothetical protein